jgi:hypothetical protein
VVLCYIDLIDLIDRIAFSEPGPVVLCYIDLIDLIAFSEPGPVVFCYIDLIDLIDLIAFSEPGSDGDFGKYFHLPVSVNFGKWILFTGKLPVNQKNN